MDAFFNAALTPVVNVLSAVIFYEIAGFPLIVLWLMAGALFFTAYLRFVNFRLLPHAFSLLKADKAQSGSKGEVSQVQALLSAISATVGLGSLAGVAVAVAVGGPGAIFWIVVMGLFGMASKFAEVTLSLQYRKFDADGKVEGGPTQYLKAGFAEKGYPQIGKILAIIFAGLCLVGGILGANMFQSNQVVKIFTHEIPALAGKEWLVSALFAAIVGLVLFGSIKRIAKVAEMVGPAKGIVYLICALIIVAVNIENLPHAFSLIFHGAFDASAVTGGFAGMLIIAFKRALFANEAGLGSAPIAHAAAKVEEPVREGSMALLEPLFAAFIALLTGLIVVVTGAHEGANLEDSILITAKAFASVGDWFTIALAINVFLFAYGTSIGWSYYCEIAWIYLFGRRGVKLYYLIFIFASFVGGVVTFSVVMDLADLLILGMALPNIVALFVMRKKIKQAMQDYIAHHKL
jgi:AGCS family alanine or glycine:cation symporter